MKLSITEARNLAYAIEDVVDYYTDNSCSDPDCCGGPWLSVEDYEAALKTLKEKGIEISND